MHSLTSTPMPPNGIVHVAMGYSQSLAIPFNDSNWRYVIDKWASLNVPFSEYNTSMLIFITYMKGNESWIVPLVIPYNVAWAIGGTTQPTSPRYIVVNALVNVNELRPNKVVPAMPGITSVNLQIPSNHSGYTTYNCDLSAPKPPPETTFKPEITCLGFNGSLPTAWVTWDKDVVQRDQGVGFQLIAGFVGMNRWNAMAVGYGVIGTSYSAEENWALGFYPVVFGSEVTQFGPAYWVTQPGSVYWYYGGATWGIVNYTVWFVNSSMGTYHLGNATIFEVLYVPPNDHYIGMVLDYGNGSVSLLYYLASRHYLGYPSSIVNYAAFIYTGQEYLYQCNGPVGNVGTPYGIAYTITLGGVETAYGLSPAQLGTTLTDLSLGSEGLGMPPPQASLSLTSVSLGLFNITTGMNLYVSVINASAIYGLPAFGFILNATNYYGNPTTYTCKYGKVTQIG